MQIINMALLFEFMMFSFVWIFLNFGLIFIIHFLIPKRVLKTYFKEPYFKLSETTALSGFPFGYIRTLMFMRILGFPSSGKRRGLENLCDIAPVWLCSLSKYVIISFITSFSLFLLIIAIGGFQMMVG